MTTGGLFVDDLASDAGELAPLVILVHGTMDRHSSFARVRSRLIGSCHVVSYDRRGYAASRAAIPPARGMADHVADLEQVVNGRRCTLVGHSYGGTVVLSFAAHHPGLAASVLAYEPPLAWLATWPTHGPRESPFSGVTPEQAAESFLRRMIGQDHYDRLPSKTRNEVVKDGEALVVELTAIRNDPAPFDPWEVTVPAIVARGELSATHHIKGAQQLVDQMPSAELRVVQGAGHGAHQSHPREFADLVMDAVRLAKPASAPVGEP
ncbi:MAG: alpha/beta fold hydrolase [Acidimicrobiales bacterium]